MTNNCKITNWKPFQKGCVTGSFTLSLPSGLVVHDIVLFQKDARRWLGMPRQRYTNKEGQECFTPIIEFRDTKSANLFRDIALRALDELLGRKVA